MNTSDYRNKLREGMSSEERNKELYRFSDYMANGNGTKQAKKHFKRKPYSTGKELNERAD